MRLGKKKVCLSLIERYKFILKKAAAIVYNDGDVAPRLLAKGRGLEAERIIHLAGEAGIEIVEDASLAALLDSGVNVGEFVPPWCWEAVAKILAFVLLEEEKL